MEFDRCLKSRRSVRKFKDKKLSKASLGAILDAVRYAPSAGNLQNWKLIVVEDKEKKEKISKVCLSQKWMSMAGALVVVCSDDSDVKNVYGERSEFYCRQNCSAAIQNMLLKACSIGIGSCWIGAFDDEKVKDILKIPEKINVEAILCFGYADEKPKMPKRVDLNDIVNFEEWGNFLK